MENDPYLSMAIPSISYFLLVSFAYGILNLILLKKRGLILYKYNGYLLPLFCFLFLVWDKWFVDSIYSIYLGGAPDHGVPNTMFLWRFIISDYTLNYIKLWSYNTLLLILIVGILSLFILAFLQGLATEIRSSLGFVLFAIAYSSYDLYEYYQFEREVLEGTPKIFEFLQIYYINILISGAILIVGVLLANWLKQRIVKMK